MTRPLAALALLTALAVRPASAQTAADRAAVRQAVLGYAQALYRADPSLVDRSVSGDLVKAGVYGGDDGLGRVPMTFGGLRALATSWNEGGSRVDPDSGLARVTVLDVLDRTASARLDAVWGADYVHLAREPDGAWRIVHVLWQPLPGGPRAEADPAPAGPPPVRRSLTPTSADTLTTEAFDALPDKAAFSGVVADRWPNGRLRLIRAVTDGRPAGLWTEWFETGVVRYLAEWDPERSGEGVWYYFHETGLVRDRSVLRRDRSWGLSEGWHPNGQKAYEGRYRANDRVGRWRWWNESGGLDSTRVYAAPSGPDHGETGWRPGPDGRDHLSAGPWGPPRAPAIPGGLRSLGCQVTSGPAAPSVSTSARPRAAPAPPAARPETSGAA